MNWKNIFENIDLKILAVIIAVVLWVIVKSDIVILGR